MSQTMSTANATKVVTSVATSAASTWSDMTVEEAIILADAAMSSWADYTGEAHYRFVMTNAMRRTDPSLSEYVADDIVDFIENEQGAIRAAERFGL